ncbi:MAG: Flp family type IVb pilin [Bacillota bacterium]
MLSLAKKLWKEEAGQGMTEYGLILGIIAIAVIAVLTLMKDQLVAVFTNITGELEDTLPAVP